MFRKLPLKANYSSETDNIYEDFFVPTLSESIVYKRAVGYFSLGVLLNVPTAMSRLVTANGRMEIIFGKLVAAADFDAIRDGLKNPWADGDLPSFQDIIERHQGSLLAYRVRLLAWLFASERLIMKVALRPEGLFHQKIAVLEDRVGDHISFSGSMNETVSALDPRYNSEEISVFCSWRPGQGEYVSSHREKFETLWSGATGSATIVTPLPEAIEAGLRFVADQFPEAPSTQGEDEAVRSFITAKVGAARLTPQVPAEFHGKPFAMRQHQLSALQKWAENDYNGILELATGAGKTITAIYAATRTIEQNEGMVLIVAVPYQDLADQWCEELRLFNIMPLRCYGSRVEWEPALRAYVGRNRDKQREFLAIVVVNRTLTSEHFQEHVSQLDPSRMFFIGDECHHHSAEGFEGKLFPKARFRIGLSATPFHYLDEERNVRLRAVYDKSVYRYTLADAVEDEVLTPYEYHPVPVELTEDEAVEYIDLSDQIARAFAAAQGKNSEGSKQKLTSLLMKRARLIGSAENKMKALEDLLQSLGEVEPYSLFYCGDGRTQFDASESDADRIEDEETLIKQRHAVSRLLQDHGVRVSPFTSDENRWQRREILSRFKNGETQALVAIRCLDEGIDVPACRTAFLIASSRNPRQFVQRRGRILRRSVGKDFAKIYDFVVVMPQSAITSDQSASDFLRAELGRVADFAQNSLYPTSSVEPILPWLRKYKLEHFAT